MTRIPALVAYIREGYFVPATFARLIAECRNLNENVDGVNILATCALTRNYRAMEMLVEAGYVSSAVLQKADARSIRFVPKIPLNASCNEIQMYVTFGGDINEMNTENGWFVGSIVHQNPGAVIRYLEAGADIFTTIGYYQIRELVSGVGLTRQARECDDCMDLATFVIDRENVMRRVVGWKCMAENVARLLCEMLG